MEICKCWIDRRDCVYHAAPVAPVKYGILGLRVACWPHIPKLFNRESVLRVCSSHPEVDRVGLTERPGVIRVLLRGSSVTKLTCSEVLTALSRFAPTAMHIDVSVYP